MMLTSKLIKRTYSNRLTVWGWLLIVVVLIGLGYLSAQKIHACLALTKPVISDLWVVEGHVCDSVVDSVVCNYQKGKCSILFTTGIPLEKRLYCDQFSNYADLTAATLINKGVDSEKVYSAPCNPTQKDRSYASALALKAKLHELGYISGNINIVSQDTHTRRSCFLFKKALGKEWKVGCISYPDFSYNPEKWWKSSYGIRSVVYECLAYLYVILFFYPNE